MGGSIQSKTNGKGKKTYYAVLSLPDGKRKWCKGKNKTDAQRILGEKLEEVARGTYKEIPKITFSKFSDFWLKNHAEIKVKPSTLASYRDIVDRLLKPFFEGYLLSNINAGRLQAYVAGRLEKVSGKTVCNEVVVIKEMFKHACRWGYLKNNPAEFLDRPKVERPEIDILEPGEIEKLLANSSEHYRVAFQTAVLTGLRAGELWGLKWSDIDWNSGQIYVRRSIWKGNFQTPNPSSAV